MQKLIYYKKHQFYSVFKFNYFTEINLLEKHQFYFVFKLEYFAAINLLDQFYSAFKLDYFAAINLLEKTSQLMCRYILFIILVCM